MTMQYLHVEPIDRDSAEQAFNSGDRVKICHALVSVAFYDPDYKWVQQKCIGFLENSDSDIRCLAITCFSHLARIHGKLDLDLVIPKLLKLKADSELLEAINDTLDELEIFLPEFTRTDI